jgi:hypothetical protein
MAGAIAVASVVAACGETATTTTVPSVTTTVRPATTTTLQPVPTTTLPPTTTTTLPLVTTTLPPVTTTTLPPVTTTQSSTTTTSPPPPLTITALSPKSGPIAGGTTVVITGTGFTGLSGAGAVTFGGVNATSYKVESATKITAKAPAHAAGVVQVKVTTSHGASANTAADDYTYLAAPTITALSPKSGPIAGGTTVVITGTGFVDVTQVLFGDLAAKFTVDSPTGITAIAPPAPPGTVQVKVIAAYGTSADSAADDYTYSIVGLWDEVIDLFRKLFPE